MPHIEDMTTSGSMTLSTANNFSRKCNTLTFGYIYLPYIVVSGNIY